jgi:hypothetical protein
MVHLSKKSNPISKPLDLNKFKLEKKQSLPSTSILQINVKSVQLMD